MDVMDIKTCRYIDASDIFKGCPDLWEMFMDSNPPFSWGDANRTMIAPSLIEDVLYDFLTENDTIEKQLDIVLNRLQHTHGVYIDLEN